MQRMKDREESRLRAELMERVARALDAKGPWYLSAMRYAHVTRRVFFFKIAVKLRWAIIAKLEEPDNWFEELMD